MSCVSTNPNTNYEMQANRKVHSKPQSCVYCEKEKPKKAPNNSTNSGIK